MSFEQAQSQLRPCVPGWRWTRGGAGADLRAREINMFVSSRAKTARRLQRNLAGQILVVPDKAIRAFLQKVADRKTAQEQRKKLGLQRRSAVGWRGRWLRLG